MADLPTQPASDLGPEPIDLPAAPLIEPDQGWIVDDEPTAVASQAVGDVGPLSAEESAVHVVGEDEAPGLSWDESPGYVEEDPGELPAPGDPSAP